MIIFHKYLTAINRFKESFFNEYSKDFDSLNVFYKCMHQNGLVRACACLRQQRCAMKEKKQSDDSERRKNKKCTTGVAGLAGCVVVHNTSGDVTATVVHS